MATTTNLGPSKFDELTAASQVTPVTNQFDESKSTAARVDAITSKGSPLMQRATTRAKQEMASRGLLNSSLAIGAGESAVIDAATPIAQNDASLFQQQSLKNQDALNQGNQFNAATRADIGTKGLSLMESARQFDTSNTSTNNRFQQELAENTRQADAARTENARQFDSGQANTLQRDAAERQQQIVMAGLDKETRLAVTQAEAASRTDIASNDNISQAWGTTMASIDKIQNNPDLDGATKQVMIENALGGFKSFSNFWKKASGGTVDVSDLLVFTEPGPARTDTGAVRQTPAAAPVAARAGQPEYNNQWADVQGSFGGG